MKKEKKVWAMTLIAFWWLAPNQTNAQQDSIKSFNLNEVVVTATKFPKSLSETGKVLTIIDEDQLSRNQGKDLSQVLNEQVGMVINGATSNPSKDKSVYLRGAGTQYTLILIDGVPVNDPSGAGGAFDPRLLPVDQVERIEILKGSQSTLYGTDAIAGVINIITKQKGEGPIGGFGTLSYGSYNTFKGTGGISGSSKILDYNLSYTHYKSDGISEAKDETGAGNFDKDGLNQNAYQFNMGIKPLRNLILKPFIRYSNFKGGYDAGSFADDPNSEYKSKLLNVGMNSQLSFSKGTLSVLYAHDKTDRSFMSSFPLEYEGLFDHAETFVNYNLADHYQILGGASFQNFKMIDANSVIENPTSDIISPYVSFFIKNLAGFSAEVGARYVKHSVYGDNLTYSINPSYMLNTKVKLFGNYTTGFKAPTLSQLYGQFGANENLKPEKSGSLEGGVEFVSITKNFDIRGTYFSRKIEDVIIYTTGYMNLDKLKDHGFEIEPSFRTDKLTLRGFYSFVEGKVTTQTPQGDETKDNDLLRRPKHSFGINVGYQLSKNLYASLNLKDFGKRKDIYFSLLDFTSSIVVLDAYQLLNVYLEYKVYGQRVKLFVDARNVLNQEYTEVYGYNTQRFNVTGGASFHF